MPKDSMYAAYLREKTNDEIIESSQGYVTYRFLNEKQVYIIDLYVKPEHRNTMVGSKLADQVCSIAKEWGCTELLGTVVPSSKNSSDSIKALLAYGMSPHGIDGVMWVLKKDIM